MLQMPYEDTRKRPTRTGRALASLRAALQRLDSRAALVTLAKQARKRLPGDHRYGDPLSLTGDEAPQLIGRGLSAMAAERPSVMRELGMSALQVWQALSEAQGRGHGDEELTIVFTDLVDFSAWTLEAGDTNALELLRQVGLAVEAPVQAHGGRVVKRLGDGIMAVFGGDPAEAVQAACEATDAVGELSLDGYSPKLRAGVHLGTPRKLGGDYFGVDVNVAARVAAAAGPGEVLISSTVRARLDPEQVSTRRRWRFKQKGTPKGLQAFVAEPG
jgi:adenylate cyclase